MRGDWEAEANQYQSVIAAALEASSTDNEHQAISKYDVQCGREHWPVFLFEELSN